MSIPTGESPVNAEEVMDAQEAQTLQFAHDLARLTRLRRAYETLVPAGLDLDALEPPVPCVRTATALFTDLRGFTALAEQLIEDPAGLLSLVNEHLTAVARAILRCGGVVEKYIGDGVFATFGARTDQPDHRERAVAAALAAVGANEALNRRRVRSGGARMEVGVGVADGTVVVGSIGPPERRELGILGDPVNIAARLVARAGAGEVLLVGSVHAALSSTVRAEVLGNATIRGRAGRLPVFRVALLGTAPATRAATRVGTPVSGAGTPVGEERREAAGALRRPRSRRTRTQPPINERAGAARMEE